MKGMLNLVVIGITLILLIGAVSATTQSTGTTIISGIVYISPNASNFVSGATVTVDCNEHIQTTTSSATGYYSVSYDEEVCHNGAYLVVSATKGDLYGINPNGVIHDDFPVANVNVGPVNVPMVPEFGVIIGGLTILSAIGIFFVVRRK